MLQNINKWSDKTFRQDTNRKEEETDTEKKIRFAIFFSFYNSILSFLALFTQKFIITVRLYWDKLAWKLEKNNSGKYKTQKQAHSPVVNL